MTKLLDRLSEIEGAVTAAKQKVFWRVTYPPSDYSGDEWDLLRCPQRDFEVGNYVTELTAQDCEYGGWKQFGFTSQGQCINYVNSD